MEGVRVSFNMMSFHQKAISSVVSALPSDQRTPSLRLTVSSVSSSLTDQDSAMFSVKTRSARSNVASDSLT